MGRIINTTDNLDAYSSIQDLGNTAATPAEIDANPLFKLAENYIISRIPDATNPNHEHRDTIILALICLTASYFLIGGGETATKQDAGTISSSGVVESTSRQAGPVRETTKFATSAGTASIARGLTTLAIGDRIQWLEDKAKELIDMILGIEVIDGDTQVLLTESRLRY